MRTEDLAYAAGIVDGEGAIGISKLKLRNGKERYALYVDVTNTDFGLIDWLLTNFGGSIYISHHTNPLKNWKTSYRWCVRSKEAESFLSELLPYLRIKKQKAKLALDFRKTCQSDRKKKPDSYYQIHKIYYLIMLKLNKKGVNSH